MLEAPKCFKRKCRHFEGVHQPDGTESLEILICKAFPKGIPDEISYGSDKHESIHPEQLNEIVYEKKND